MTNTASTSTTHLQAIEKKGKEWGAKLRANRFIKPRVGWLSYQIQLKPALEWGLVCLNLPLKDVEERLGAVYWSFLGALNVNKNITKEVRCLPEMFQGLGMFNLNVDGLGARIHFLKHNWGLNTAAGHLLRHAYKVFQIEVAETGLPCP